MVGLLSYIFPITKKVKSEFNGILEITWYNGKKHLNTKNANYSYGSLQKILKIGIEQINMNSCKSILILGLGGGSVIRSLYDDFNYKESIVAVDFDPVIIKIAQEEFAIVKSKTLEIICDDALNYIKENRKQFDLIIIDLFIDTLVPSKFLSDDFWKYIIQRNTKNGSILFNASLNDSDISKLKKVDLFLNRNGYQINKMEKVDNTNTLWILTH